MRKAGDIITSLFRERFGPEFMESARSSADLFSSWARIVTEVWPRTSEDGAADIPAVAVHSRIRELERGFLLVEADHPGWIQILQTKQKELLTAVQRRYPELNIRGLAFKLSKEPFPPPAAEEPIAENQEELEEQEDPQEDQTRIGHTKPKDEEFYAALKGLEKTIKQRNRNR